METFKTLPSESLTFSFIFVLFLWGVTGGYAQNIGINSTGAAPNISALLDIDAAPGNNKGLLIPRISLLSTLDVTTIPTPATSLLVYNNNVAMVGGALGYWYWDGVQWIQLGGTNWKLSGNSGIVDSTNFIGTTDNKPFNIRVNNVEAGRIGIAADGSVFLGYEAGLNDGLTANDNTFIGYQAGKSNSTGSYNTALGYSALTNTTFGVNNTAIGSLSLATNIIGSQNTAIGFLALWANTGSNNTALGSQALRDNTSGAYNVAIGTDALTFCTSGRFNTANGYKALANITSGSGNTAIGYQAASTVTNARYTVAVGHNALLNSTSSYNTALGYLTLQANTTGARNSATGFKALVTNSTGSWNTANGSEALISNTTGTKNSAFGYLANVSVGTLNNATAIGANSVVNANNKIRLGSATVTVVEGPVAYTVSDGRFKKNVTETVEGLEFITKLRPVVYNFDTRKFDEFLTKNMPDSIRQERMKHQDYAPSTAIRQSGFIAQEVEQSAKEVGYDFNGVHIPENENDNYSLSYQTFVVPLVKSVQEQQIMIKELIKQNEEIRKEIALLKNRKFIK